MTILENKKLLLGVTGGIAAYKTAELVRLLKKEGAEVRVVMTKAATKFVTPLTFQALSGNPVATDLLDADADAAMGHINLVRWADLVLVAPATANFIAKLRTGLADDLLSTLCLAADVPIALAPAMNRMMWQNEATRENCRCLRRRSIQLFGPDEGEQACGELGPGRMVEPQALVDSIRKFFEPGILEGVSVLISAGPTRESIDPVRFISNRSSGKMGYAVAEAAAKAGASVTLVSGPVALAAPGVDEVVVVETAKEMAEAVLERASDVAIYIGIAAVSDYSPAVVETSKIKKEVETTTLVLNKTVDILGAVSALEDRPFCVGFAAETDSVEAYARRKLHDKKLDMIAANLVGGEQGGFESDENALHVFWDSGDQLLKMVHKKELAKQLIKVITEKYNAKNST